MIDQDSINFYKGYLLFFRINCTWGIHHLHQMIDGSIVDRAAHSLLKEPMITIKAIDEEFLIFLFLNILEIFLYKRAGLTFLLDKAKEKMKDIREHIPISILIDLLVFFLFPFYGKIFFVLSLFFFTVPLKILSSSFSTPFFNLLYSFIVCLFYIDLKLHENPWDIGWELIGAHESYLRVSKG